MSITPAAVDRPMGAVISAVFIVLWSSGFVGARLGLPDADPFTFLALRFAAASAMMALIALVTRAPWPRGRRLRDTAISGVMIHGAYLGGVFVGIWHGVPPGIAALIVGLQPLLTGALSGLVLGDRIALRQWMGLLLGLAGVVLVLSDRIGLPREAISALPPVVLALVSITAGTLYQKKFFGPTDIRAGAAVQYAVCALVFLPLAVLGPQHLTVTPRFAIAFVWAALVLSVITVSLFYVLIRRGSAAKVVSLMYLVPPVTAVEAYLLFGDPLGPLSFVGMIVVAVAVALVNRSPAQRNAPR